MSVLRREQIPFGEFCWRGDLMVGITGLFSVVIGAIITYVSERCPSHIEAIETAAGILVLGGFCAAIYGLSDLFIA